MLHPCDGNQTAKLVAAMADADGIAFLRTLRPDTPVIYDADEEFEIGGSRVLRSTVTDDVTIIAAGVTVHEALEAAETLAAEDIGAKVIDAYSIKPLDVAGIAAGNGKGMIFRNGEIVRRVDEEQIVEALMEEVARWEVENAGKLAVKPVEQGVEGIGRRKLPVVAG